MSVCAYVQKMLMFQRTAAHTWSLILFSSSQHLTATRDEASSAPTVCNSFLVTALTPFFLSVFLSSALLFITTDCLFLVSFHIICKMLFVKSAILFFFFFNKDLWSSSNTKVIDTFHSQYSYKHPEWNFMLVLFVILFCFVFFAEDNRVQSCKQTS